MKKSLQLPKMNPNEYSPAADPSQSEGGYDYFIPSQISKSPNLTNFEY